ncbi:hypothetical protein D3C86_1030920 [compost metagenome]
MIKNLRWPIHFLFGLLLFFVTGESFAQNNLVRGQVLNEIDQPIAGISIKVKGTTTGTVSDALGHFAIRASANDILVFSAVSFKAQEVNVVSGKEITVKMVMDMVRKKEAI